MPIFRLRGAGNKGVNSDIPPFDLPPDTWSDGNNVRFQAGRVQKIGGSRAGLLRNMPNEQPIAVVQQPLKDALVYGTGEYTSGKGSLYQALGPDHKNISKVGEAGKHVTYPASPSTPWEYTVLSNSLIFANKLTDPQGLVPTSENFTDLPGWGQPKKAGGIKVDWKTNRVRAYKNYLLCLGMFEGNLEYPQRVRWSDIAYVGALPANWWEDSPENDGGFNDLSDSLSHIIDGRPLRDSFVIYTNRDTFIMDYVGGGMVFNFRKIFSDSGILAPNCVVEYEGKHFVISEEDIFVHNGSTRTPVATGRIKDRLMKEISSVNYLATKVFSYPTRKEIWIMYVGPGNTSGSVKSDEESYACNRAAIWSWEYDTWSFADLPGIYDVTLGVPPDTDSRTWELHCGTENQPIPPGCEDTWDGEPHTEEVWEEFAQTFTRHQMYAPSRDKCFYTLDDGYYFYSWDADTYHTDNNARPPSTPIIDPTLGKYLTRSPVVCELTKSAIDFDEQEQDISYYKWWRAIYPQMSGIGDVRFFIGGADNPWKAPSWDSSQMFSIGTDWKVDCFSNYRYPAIKIQDSAEGQWDFTGYDVEYFREGNR